MNSHAFVRSLICSWLDDNTNDSAWRRAKEETPDPQHYHSGATTTFYWGRGSPLQAQLVLVSVLVLGVMASVSSVSACALGTHARGGDVEEGLGLPKLGPSLQVIHVGCRGLCIWAYGKREKNKYSVQWSREMKEKCHRVLEGSDRSLPVCRLLWGGLTLARGGTPRYWGRSMGAWGWPLMWRWGSDVLSRGRNLWAVLVLVWGSCKMKKINQLIIHRDISVIRHCSQDLWQYQKNTTGLFSEVCFASFT